MELNTLKKLKDTNLSEIKDNILFFCLKARINHFFCILIYVFFPPGIFNFDKANFQPRNMTAPVGMPTKGSA